MKFKILSPDFQTGSPPCQTSGRLPFTILSGVLAMDVRMWLMPESF